MSSAAKNAKLLNSIKSLLTDVAEVLDARISVKLWDGTLIPLGQNADPNIYISLAGPGVIGSLMRKPTVVNFVRHFATGLIDFHGADFITFAEQARIKNSRKRAKKISKLGVIKKLLPFLFVPAEKIDVEHEYGGDETGYQREQAENKDFIQFHYDVSNDFYKLFLDEKMVYTCAYFTDWNNTLEQAQTDKLDMICRKLQMQPGEKFLDIGCGWGALVMHAAKHYGVHAHGVTLSQAQIDFANDRIKAEGLEDLVTVELIDYAHVEGTYDKISSIGMIEHVGLDNIPGYMKKINSLLRDRGLYLNHGITRPAKQSKKKFRKLRPEQKMLMKYIFPGGELDHIGNTLDCLESNGFRVEDVEGWRDHYGMTCRMWCQRLSQNQDEAIRLVGKEKYRLWVAYLGCVSFSLAEGSACLFQTVSTKHAQRGHSGMPPTRSHLYEDRSAA